MGLCQWQVFYVSALVLLIRFSTRVPTPLEPSIMDFSDDEDFFARAADEQEELSAFQGHDCHFVPEELPPEEETGIECNESSQPHDHGSSQPCDEATLQTEEVSTSPTETSDAGSSSTSSPHRPLPVVLEFRGRKRIREKAPRPWIERPDHWAVEQASSQPPGFPGIPSIDDAANDWWDAKPDRERKRYFWNAVKRMNLYNTYLKTLTRGRLRSLPATWGSLESDDLKEFINWVVRNPSVQFAPCVKAWLRVLAGLESPSLTVAPELDRTIDAGMQLLATWQGPWGVIKKEDAAFFSDELSAIEMLKKDPYIQVLWEKALALVDGVKTKLGANDMGACLELCTRTFAQGTIRIHLHACFVVHSGRLRKIELSAMKVFGTPPHVSGESRHRQHKRRAAQHSGMYYVVAPKIGSLFTFATMRPHYEFEVNAEWIWSLVASHKIELSAARRELVASGKNLVRHLQNMDVLIKERANEANENLIVTRNAAIEATRRPFRKIPAVDAWMRELSAPQDRRKFLVLDGPTRMGKTAFAFSIVKAGAALEVNCAGVEDPPLRAFSRAKHRLILFDEASTHMVLKNKRLFQAPNTPVIVGSSPTNALAYSVFLGDTMLVVSSNDWVVELAALPRNQRDWLEGNMVFVSVTEKLYL